MNEQQRYDELDRAIDALISQGEPAPTGDADLDALARLASGLRGLPDPDFKARLQAELVPRPAGRHWLPFTWGHSLIAGVQRIARRPLVVVPLALGTAAVAAAVIAILVVAPRDIQPGPAVTPGPGATEQQAFGTLPAPSESGGPVGGGGRLPRGPGYTGTITYTLSPDLSLPASALVYRLQPVTPERVQDIARKLGFTESVEPTTAKEPGIVVGYRVASAPACPPDLPPPPPDRSKEEYEAKACQPARVFQMMLDGSFFFDDITVSRLGSAPSEEQALAAARDWLLLTGLTGGEPFTLKVEPVDEGGQGFREVVVEPERPPDLVLDHLSIRLFITGDGKVSEASGSWATIDAQSTYPLHSAEQLLSDLQALRGNFWDFSHIGPEPLSIDPMQDASATVESVEVSYTRGVAADGQAFFVPVYIVKGHLTQVGLGEPLPFTTRVPATDTAPTLEPTPEADAELTKLAAVHDSLPLHPSATLSNPDFFSPGPGLGLATAYLVQDEPDVVVQFYRRELPAQGWQPEEPPTLRSTDVLGFALQSSFISFVKGDLRVAIVVSPDAENPGATLLFVVVEAPEVLCDALKPQCVAQVTNVAPQRLNVRGAPTTTADVIGKLSDGETVCLTGPSLSGDGFRWWPIRSEDGIEGWVAQDDPQEPEKPWLSPTGRNCEE